MSTYHEILDAQLNPRAPATSMSAHQLRDNMLAIAAGAAGAPRLAVPEIEVLDTPGGPITWTVPAGCYRVRVLLLGGGGGGGGGGASPGGGGGGGGALVATVAVEPGQSYELWVGGGGSVGSSDNDGGPGTHSVFGVSQDLQARGGDGGGSTGSPGLSGDGVIAATPAELDIRGAYIVRGQWGGRGSAVSGEGGWGGASHLDFGPRSSLPNADGSAGRLGGSGGAGGAGSGKSGGAGGGGMIIIEY